jgi:hypothetical protein
MTSEALRGAPQFPSIASAGEASSREAMDEALSTLSAHKHEWVQVTLSQRITVLDRLIRDFSAIAPRWVAACLAAKGLSEDSPFAGEEWMAGTWPIVKNLRLLRRSLLDIKTYGQPRIPGRVRTLENGQVAASVFPETVYDRIFLTGVSAEIWMEPGVTAETLPQTQAVVYQNKQHPGKVALVLGAGNVASIGPMDILYKLFVEDQVVIYKSNPVNAYLGPLIEESFRALIEPGYLRLAYGGAEEGAYLCNHPEVEEIHITGSDKTFDAIVFGPGPEGAERKAYKQPLLNKRITGELGNVSPVIVVPGPWKDSDLDYQAEHIVTMLTNNAGFNCNATRVVIQHGSWSQRASLLGRMRNILARVPVRKAYYPGAQKRYQAFVADHPDAERFGSPTDDQLPWTLISGVDAYNDSDICFTTEAFCGLFAETSLAADNTLEYIERAVDFCNNHLWGSLNATIIVHPQSQKDPAVAAAVERAVAELRYGSVGVNYWAGASFVMTLTTWGAFPGHPIHDIQSGVGVVHNTLMFSQPQKSVIRAPFRSIPRPPWFVLQGQKANKVFPRLVEFEAHPSPLRVPEIVWYAVKG